jgi:hypothetical protein
MTFGNSFFSFLFIQVLLWVSYAQCRFPPSSTFKIAIIGMLVLSPQLLTTKGAGAGGSSTAYHLAKFAAKAGHNVSLTVFERNDYVGGRAHTVNILDDPRFPVELGIIFVLPGLTVQVQVSLLQ